MEETAEVEARHLADEVARGGEHHIVVLERGPGLRRERQVPEVAHQLERVLPDGQVVTGIPGAVAEGILDGDVGGGPVVAEDEILAQEGRDGTRPAYGGILG